jgi:hypothetical protein
VYERVVEAREAGDPSGEKREKEWFVVVKAWRAQGVGWARNRN